MRSSNWGGQRRGFTLVELVVCIAVVSVLLSLGVPAVQQARERARGIACSQQLRQIGLALHNYHSAHNVFPMGSSKFVAKTNSTRAAGAWGYLAYLLPYIDESPRWQSIDFKSPNCCDTIIQMQSGGGDSPVSSPVRLALCPSDPLAGQVHESGVYSYPCGRLYPGNYLGISGDGYQLCREILNGNGILYSISSVRMGDVTDGLSQTLIVGERGIPTKGIWGWLICGGTECEQYLGTYLGLAPGADGGSTVDLPGRFWSWHTGGGHFVFADGRVRFLSYAIDDTTFKAISTRRQKETTAME